MYWSTRLLFDKKFCSVAFIVGVTCLLIACSSRDVPSSSSTEGLATEPSDWGQATSTPTAVSGFDHGEDAASCPNQQTAYELFADHDFWTDTGFGEWHWEANGAVPLVVEADQSVSENSSGIIMGRQYGAFSSDSNACQFEAPAEINVIVSGICLDGVLFVEITETWMMGTYQWTCDDDSFQYDIPLMEPILHPNLEFPLADQTSYSLEIPWGGGSGSEVWTLSPSVEPASP